MMDHRDECRPFLVHLRDEHRELHNYVRDIQLQLRRSDSELEPNGMADLIERLSQLHTRLKRHFAEEEEGGCMEEAVSRQPSLSTQVRELEVQHPALLRQLEELIQRGRKERLPANARRVVDTDFRAFAKALLAHEAQENRVLQLGFNVNMDMAEL